MLSPFLSRHFLWTIRGYRFWTHGSRRRALEKPQPLGLVCPRPWFVFAGLTVALLLPRLADKLCPFCREAVDPEASVCPHCQRTLAEAPTTEAAPATLPISDVARSPHALPSRLWVLALVLALGSLSLLYRPPPVSHPIEQLTIPTQTPRVVTERPTDSAPVSITPAPQLAESWQADLSIIKQGVSRSGFTITWRLTIKNSSSRNAYKDIRFKTEQFAPSGTKLGENPFAYTAYRNFDPGKTVDIVFQESAHGQAKSGDIEIAGAVRR